VIKKSLCTLWLEHTSFLPHYLAQSDCLAADHQGQADTRLILTPSVIPNSTYLIMVTDWNSLKYFCMFFFVLKSSGAHRLFDHPVCTNIYRLTTCIARSRCSNTCGSLKMAVVGSQKHVGAVKPTVQLVGKKLVWEMSQGTRLGTNYI
jgi:hypothetical protein